MVLRQGAPPDSPSKEPYSHPAALRSSVEAYNLRRTLDAYRVKEIPVSRAAKLLKKLRLHFLRAQASADEDTPLSLVNHLSDWYEVKEIESPEP